MNRRLLPALRPAAVALFMGAASAAGAMNLKYTEPAPPAAPSLLALLVRMALALGLVIGLIYLTAAFLKRAQPGALGRGRRGAPAAVEVETHVALGPKRSLYSVRWGRFRLLLGAGASEISLLASVWDEQGAPEAAAPARAELPDQARFERHLDDFLSRLGRMEDDPSV